MSNTVRAIESKAVYWGRNVGSLDFKLDPKRRTQAFIDKGVFFEGFDEAMLLTRNKRATKWDMAFYVVQSNTSSRELRIHKGVEFADIKRARLPHVSRIGHYFHPSWIRI